jgi:hypothetical protein
METRVTKGIMVAKVTKVTVETSVPMVTVGSVGTTERTAIMAAKIAIVTKIKW